MMVSLFLNMFHLLNQKKKRMNFKNLRISLLNKMWSTLIKMSLLMDLLLFYQLPKLIFSCLILKLNLLSLLFFKKLFLKMQFFLEEKLEIMIKFLMGFHKQQFHLMVNQLHMLLTMELFLFLTRKIFNLFVFMKVKKKKLLLIQNFQMIILVNYYAELLMDLLYLIYSKESMHQKIKNLNIQIPKK